MVKISAARGSPAHLNRNSLALFVAPCQEPPQSLTSKGLDQSGSVLWKLGQIAIGSNSKTPAARHPDTALPNFDPLPGKPLPIPEDFFVLTIGTRKRIVHVMHSWKPFETVPLLRYGLFGLVLTTDLHRSSMIDEKNKDLGMTSPRLTRRLAAATRHRIKLPRRPNYRGHCSVLDADTLANSIHASHMIQSDQFGQAVQNAK